MGRNCSGCHKGFKNARGLRRHQFYCFPARAVAYSQHVDTDLPDDASSVTSSSRWTEETMASDREDDDDEQEGTDTRDISDAEGLYNTTADGELLDSDFVNASQQVLSWSRGTISSGGVTIIDTYFEVEGGTLPPGYVYPEDGPAQVSDNVNSTTTSLPCLYSTIYNESDPQSFFPFQDFLEYKISWWLFKTRLSDTETKELFAIGGLWSKLSLIRSVRTWKQILHRIPYGIPNDSIIETDITVQIPGSDRTLKYTVRYRSILSIVQFLVSFPAFAPNLTYAPVRLYKDEQRSVPIWNEMWTGSWWWDQQSLLPPGSTLIPVLLASDKTQLTQHHGDKSTYPVYMTIGNLDKKTRRAQKRPSKILLGFLPIIDKNHHRLTGDKRYTFRRNIINTAMGIMTRELQRVEAEGLRLRCADGHIRHCYPTIAGFSVDYEEQAFLTGVKSGQHCVTCRIPPDDRATLTPLERYPLRDHRYSQTLIRYTRSIDPRRGQISEDLMYEKDMWIDDVIMHIDVLHQCFKGLVHRSLNDWIFKALQHLYGHTHAATALDDRFRTVPAFPNIKRFPSYSTVSQWTGVEQKALLRQVVPVLAPILPPAMIQFVRAMVDFTLHAQYYSHDSDTLSWMEAALTRMDVLKEAFREYTAPGTGFNIPKLHAITHYPMMIRKFGSADGYDTAMFEAGHKYIIKDWYPLTNKRDTFEQQIFAHNQRAVNMLAMHDLVQFRSSKNTTPWSKLDPAQATTVSRSVDLDHLDWPTAGPWEETLTRRMLSYVPVRKVLPHIRREQRYWRQASTVAQAVGQSGFLDALAVFVREERRRARGVISNNIAMNMKESDSSWINGYLVSVHPSMSCWKSDRDDGTNADVRVKEYVRCDPNWQGKGVWRRDCVWIQEYPDTADHRRPLQGRLPARMLVVVSVLDAERLGYEERASIYTGAFLDVYSLRDQGQQSRTHGMIEAQRHPANSSGDRRSLGHRRFYHLGLILRSVHLVPASNEASDMFYINSYVDWEQYTTVFDADFLAKDAAVVRQIGKRHGWIK